MKSQPKPEQTLGRSDTREDAVMNLVIILGDKGGGVSFVAGSGGPCQSEHCLWCLGESGITSTSARAWVGGFDDVNADEDVSERNPELLGLIKECVLAPSSVVGWGSET